MDCSFLNKIDSNHPFLVLNKQAGLPSAPLKEGDESALTFAISKFPELKNVKGRKEVEYGLIHRIDTETSGLVLIAATQEFYDFMIEEQKNGNFEKWYRAEIQKISDCSTKLGGFPSVPVNFESDSDKIIVESAFRPFGPKGREVRPVTAESGKAASKKGGQTIYRTEISISENKAVAHIVSGYRHQVRCHLAWCGCPIKGDKIYNPDYKDCNQDKKMAFEAFKIKFTNPVTGEAEVYQI